MRLARDAASRDATRGSRRRLAADAAWPGCGRSACNRSSNAASVPSRASIVMAATTSAVRSSRSARASAMIPTASMPCVPLTSARPSFAPSSSGARPARDSAPAAGSAPSPVSSRPRPSSGSARHASGARSPDAPSDPCWGTAGIRSRFSISTIRSTTSTRTPECPSASTCARSTSIARASARERSGPTAVACDVTIPRCNVAASDGSIRVSASAPNPVVTPYIVSPSATARSITSRDARMRPRGPSPRVTGAPSATRSTSSSVSGSPSATG